jgi:glycosyltransferase involved in cell wall biosynthesis
LNISTFGLIKQDLNAKYLGLENMVSIVIPCYNQACYLEEAVKSVLNSSYKDFEIIIVNDGSSDNTEEVALKLQKEIAGIRYFYQENKGPSSARNLGIKNSEGSIILPLDADDLISPSYIEEAVKVLENQKNVKVVYCEAEMFGEKIGKWIIPDFSINKLVRRNLIFSTAFYKKSDWERIGGYDEKMTWSLEDWDFWLSMLKDGGEVVRLPMVGFFYRISKNTRTENARNEGLAMTISYFNVKHKNFIYKKLGGPLRRRKKMSKIINFLTGTTFRLMIKNK